jgi:hypothetical protein
VGIHGRNIRNNLDFHITMTNLTICQKGTYYMGLNIFNKLSSYIKEKFNNESEFKRLIRNFLYCNNFYTLEECFSYKDE